MYPKNGDVTINYEIFGGKREKPVLVLIFGFSMTLHDWLDFGYVENLQKHFNVITIEPRGHGNSSCPLEIEAYSLELMVSDIRTVLDHLKISQVIVWGYSLGAKIALALAESSSDKIEGLVLGGFELHSIVDLSNDIVTDTLKRGGIAWRNLMQQMFTVPQATAERFEQVNTRALLSLRHAEKDWPTMHSVPQKINVPVLLYAGENCFYRDDVRDMSTVFTNCQYIEMMGVNHFQIMPMSNEICDSVILFFNVDKTS